MGHFRNFREGVRVTPFMMATSELRRVGRRGVTPQHLLYMAMEIMRFRVRDSLTVAFKHVGKNANITSQQIESEEYINNERFQTQCGIGQSGNEISSLLSDNSGNQRCF
ncbi:serine--tRNA ligase [Trichonephila clavata]|uniref:Serine--tRNA ligase n=1 Tax=Trichonephila clavata TaxID=2740835 RepID=A0A8X6I9S6_TRICU|nr:serine--tRNA ligase [Trichonephila clavata]